MYKAVIPAVKPAVLRALEFGGAGVPVPSFSAIFTNGSLAGAITFTRSGVANYYASTSTMTLAASDVPRFDYNPATLTPLGLLIEGARTNLNAPSVDFSGYTTSNLSVTAAAATAPDGTMTMTKLGAVVGTVSRLITRTASLTSGTSYTMSIVVSAAEVGWFQVAGGGSVFAATVFASFDVTNGVVGTVGAGCTASIQNLGNGRFRCMVTATATATLAANAFVGYLIGNADAATRGPSVAMSAGQGVYIWGASIEAGGASSYIETPTASIVARAQDVATVNTLSSIGFNATTNSDVVTFRPSQSSVGGSRPIIQYDDGSDTNSILITVESGVLLARVRVADVNQCNLNLGSVTAGNTYKIAFARAASSFAASVNGAPAVTGGVGNMPVGLTTLRYGSDFVGNKLFATIANHAVYASRVSDTQLVTLST